MGDTVKLHSLIKKYFNKDLLFQLDSLSMMHDVDNNTKGIAVMQILTTFGINFKALGSGTNRYAILLDGYCFKIALDEDGKTDNKREFMYSKLAQPYVIKVYECMSTGLICSCEYMQVFEAKDFLMPSVQKEMREILKELTKVFLIGDIGIDDKNYTNWGYKLSDGSIAILDFAYIYKLSYQVFQCTCPERGMLHYTKNYNSLVCPVCNKEHSFWDIRKRISRQQELGEIGNILEKGYVVDKEWSVVPFDDRFSYSPKNKKKKAVSVKKDKIEDDEELTLNASIRKFMESLDNESEE